MSLFSRARLGALALVGMTLLLAACGSSSTASSTPGGVACPSPTSLTGAGSTFDNPLFTKQFQVYPAAKCGIQVNYQSVGSGAGIAQLLAGTVDFGATDAPMKDTDLAKSTQGPILHIPVTLGAVAMTYNLAGVTKLQLTGDVIAQIFLGKITTWNDAAIAALNAGVTLPNQKITVEHRSDGSGTTGIFAAYLSAVNADWKAGPGSGTTLNWPVGVGSKGNDGVTASTKQTAGAIGYVEAGYATVNNLPVATVQNAANAYVGPTLDAIKAAADNYLAQNAASVPADLRFFIVNAPGAASYPIAGFSWVIVYQNQSDSTKGQNLANTLWWMTHDGQQYSNALNYAVLPASIATKDEAQIKKLQCGGSACYKGLFG
ncbi:MAG: phosphate ABC transporter substrate-binding protein PstS [Ktedonobacterales bacterium]|nr:phosphate ABC transporter substrate-binding protein PstS [Ktedonobacterales bacterium]